MIKQNDRGCGRSTLRTRWRLGIAGAATSSAEERRGEAHQPARPLHLLQRLGLGAALTASCSLGLAGAASGAQADGLLYCGPSTYIDYIEVEPWADDHFKIVVQPSTASRVALDPAAATVEMWHAIQACVPGLYGFRADTIWDQLECHQWLALVPSRKAFPEWASGSTYDLETWRPLLRPATYSSWQDSSCGNRLSTDPAGPFGDPYRPDAGQLDLAVPKNVA